MLRKLFLKNWGLKLFSFLLALVLWLTLIPEEKIFSEKTLTVPLEIHNIPSRMEMVEKPPSVVDVKIRAPKSLIGQVTSANVHAVLDLREARIDVQDYPLTENMISIPQGAEVKDVFPSQVRLKLENSSEVMLEVEPVITGKPPEGFSLIKTEVIPPQVRIEGPESKVKDDYKVKTTPIDISSFTQSISVEANLILPNSDLRLATSRTTVTVKLLIQKKNTVEQPPEKKK